MRKKKSFMHRLYIKSLLMAYTIVDAFKTIYYTTLHVVRVAKMVTKSKDYVLVVRYEDSTGYCWSARNAESASDLCMHGASMIDSDNM